MSTPFNGEEMYAKRSFLTSLWGLKIGKSSKNAGHPPVPPPPPPNQYIPNDQPCSSKSLFSQPVENPISQAQQFHEQYRLSSGDYHGRERSLSEQLADTLLLASPEPPQQILSPHDIYKEIVCECAHFEHSEHHEHHQHIEQQQQIIDPNMYPSTVPNQTQYYDPYNQSMPMPYQMETRSTAQSPCPHCHSNIEPQKRPNAFEELASRSTLEDLVKLVVAAVKDAGMLGKGDKKQESPEEILRRKRQQNNEAAARYRKRQREAKMLANNELEILTSRNVELKQELTLLQEEINKKKMELSQKRGWSNDQVPSTVNPS
uniref:BZIP domain-containing protein n=1 Tax=Panagrolaimus sp. JU765 TaxID=591449 RepID=A0AC34QT46_9BILA